jgi:hypothetical protein
MGQQLRGEPVQSRITRKISPRAAQVKAKDWSNYQGKILRMELDGSIPADNPVIDGVAQSRVHVGPPQSSRSRRRAEWTHLRVRARTELG